MKHNTTVTIVISALIVLVLFQFLYYNNRVDRLNKKISIEAAKTSFALRQFDDKDVPFDSMYAQYDTVSFYKNGAYLGKTITVTE